MHTKDSLRIAERDLSYKDKKVDDLESRLEIAEMKALERNQGFAPSPMPEARVTGSVDSS